MNLNGSVLSNTKSSFCFIANSCYFQYGLQAAFKEIERLHHEVTDAGNPISMDLKTRYVVKGIGKEQTIASKIQIFYDKSTGKITQVQDKWDGNLPDSTFTNVSVEQLLNPWWYVHYAEGWAWWGWSFTWNTWWWQVRGGCLLEIFATKYLSDLHKLVLNVAEVETLKANTSADRSFANSIPSRYPN